MFARNRLSTASSASRTPDVASLVQADFCPSPPDRGSKRRVHRKVRVAEFRLLSPRCGSRLEPAFPGLLCRCASSAVLLFLLPARDGMAAAMSSSRALGRSCRDTCRAESVACDRPGTGSSTSGRRNDTDRAAGWAIRWSPLYTIQSCHGAGASATGDCRGQTPCSGVLAGNRRPRFRRDQSRHISIKKRTTEAGVRKDAIRAGSGRKRIAGRKH